MKPLISIIIPTYNEERYIKHCIESLEQQSIKEPFDIIIADGRSTDKTRSVVKKLQKKHENIILLDNKEKRQAQGRNLAIRYSKAQYITYIDGHSYADKDWLKTLYETYSKLQKTDKRLGAVGSIHKDAGNTKLSRATTTAMNSLLGGGLGSSYSEKKTLRKVDTAYACLYEKKIFDQIGYYDKRFYKGQDLELNLRISKQYSFYLEPRAVTYYYKRESIKQLWKQMYRYGFWRWKVMRHVGKINPITLLPSIGVLSLLLLIIISAASNTWAFISIPLLAYIVGTTLVSLAQTLMRKGNFTLILVSYLCIHYGYGAGMIEGWMKRTDKMDDRT